jgi:DNA-binding MarR family transcriptional regulator
MTLAQLITLHLISALGPVSLTALAQALGTKTAATSAMVDRLNHAGLVCRTPDPQDRRRVQLTVTTDAERILGDTKPDTAKRLQGVLTAMSTQTRRHLIEALIDTVASLSRDRTRRPRPIGIAGLVEVVAQCLGPRGGRGTTGDDGETPTVRPQERFSAHATLRSATFAERGSGTLVCHRGSSHPELRPDPAPLRR